MASTPEQKQETKAEKFVRLAEMRVGNAITAMDKIHNLANKNQYEFTAAQVEKITDALLRNVENLSAAFDDALKGKAAKKSGPFSLSQ